MKADVNWVIRVQNINKPGAQFWELRSDLLQNYRKETDGQVDIPDAADFCKSLRERLSDTAPHLVHDRLKGQGKILWSRTPRWFQEAYWAMWDRKPNFSLQLFSRDNLVPWEYVTPADVDRNEREEVLILRHPVARRTMSQTSPNPNYSIPIIEDGQIAVVAPTYDDRLGVCRLPRRNRIVRKMKWRFKAIEILGKRHNVLSLFKGNAVSSCSAIYYYGHGAANDAHALGSRLLMEHDVEDVAADDANGAGMQIGTRNHTLAVLAACEVGTSGSVLGVAEGWPTILLDNQFGGVVAPLWKIDAEHGAEFSINLMSEIIRGKKPIAEAIFALRKQLHSAYPSILSFLYFGDVHTVFHFNPKNW